MRSGTTRSGASRPSLNRRSTARRARQAAPAPAARRRRGRSHHRRRVTSARAAGARPSRRAHACASAVRPCERRLRDWGGAFSSARRPNGLAARWCAK
eukprot:7386715-Prymnesium_polylepis.2